MDDSPVLGSALRAARESAGVGLREFARRTHWSAAYLSQVERGVRPVCADISKAYTDMFGMELESAPASDDPLRIAHEWLVADPPPVEQLAAGRRVGSGLADEMERRVVKLRRLDDKMGGTTLHPVVRCDLDAAWAVVRESTHSADVERRLLRVVGELSQLAGWVYADAGQHGRAQDVYLDGVRAAASADDKPPAGQLLSTLSYLLSNSGSPRDATLLARTALHGAAPDASPVVRALLGERIAWAAAKSGDTTTALRALDNVDAEYGDRSPDDIEPDWTYWLNRDEIDIMRARCAVELGDATTAEALLTPVLNRYPITRRREAALYRTWLAEAHIRSGHLDAARATQTQVDRDTGSDPVERRARDLERLLER